MTRQVGWFVAGPARELAGAVALVERAAEQEPDVESLPVAARDAMGREV
jgi:hypothetical protein